MRNITTKTGIIRSLRRFYNNIIDQHPNQELTEIFDIVPTTFIMSSQYKTTDMYRFIKRFSDLSVNEGLSLKENMPAKHCMKNMWLLKPATLNQGRGIQIFSKIKDIFDHIDGNSSSNNYWVVQKYIEKPLLFNSRKFDIRIWVLVTTSQTGQDITVYVYKEGYLRTSSSKYDLNDENKYVHLTNNCLQQKGNQYSLHESGNTLSFQAFQDYLDLNFSEQDIKIERDLMPRMKDIIIDTIQSIIGDLNPLKRKNQFQLLGYDFLIDEDFRVWLLEVNNNPYLGVPNKFIENLLPQMIRDMFKIVIPNQKLQQEVKLTKNKFEKLYCTKDNFTLRRDYTLDLVYPISKFRQQIGKNKKQEILQQRKEKFRAQQSGDSLTKVTLKHDSSLGRADLQFKTSRDYHSQASSRAFLLPLSKSTNIIEDYKELNKLALMNKQLLNQINGGSLVQTPGSQMDPIQYQLNNDVTNGLQPQNKTPITQLKRNQQKFNKDFLEQIKFMCERKESKINQEQFDQLFGKVLSRIQQWQLFDDKQIEKSQKAIEIIFNIAKMCRIYQSKQKHSRKSKKLQQNKTTYQYFQNIYRKPTSKIMKNKQIISQSKKLNCNFSLQKICKIKNSSKKEIQDKKDQEKEARRKIAEEHYQKRISEKQKQLALQKQKILEEQQIVEKQMEEMRSQKLDKLMQKNKERQRDIQYSQEHEINKACSAQLVKPQ
eukprot:403335638